MAAGSPFAAITSLADPAVPVHERLLVAKRLKNLLVGQDLRKEAAVKNAIIPPLAAIIADIPNNQSKKSRITEPTVTPLFSAQEWTSDSELQLQALAIISSLASVGQHILKPLCAANVPKLLVNVLAFDVRPALLIAALQALLAFAEVWAATDRSPDWTYDLWSIIFNANSLEYFDALLRSLDHEAKLQQPLIISLIASLGEDRECPTSTKSLIANHGLIDTLTTLLVSHARPVNGSSSATLVSLSSLGATSIVPDIIAAISATISGSNYRAHCFILSPALRDLFPSRGQNTRSQYCPRQGFFNGHECLLPPLHIPAARTVIHASRESSNFPALALFQGNAGRSDPVLSTNTLDIDHSNAVCGWLLVIARSFAGIKRLAALHLLALVVNAIESDPVGAAHKSEYLAKTHERVRQLALLAVPLAVSLVQTASETPSVEETDHSNALSRQILRARACITLGLLIESSKHLQIAAVQARAIEYVTPILRKSFDTYTPSKPMWSSHRPGPDAVSASATSTLGPRSLQPEFMSIMLARAGALHAIAAIASREDIHRQAIIDSGAISCIIDALKPFPRAMLLHPFHTSGADASLKPADGNTTPVIIAACRAAQSLSRSVAVLRTSLVDGGIVVPLVFLLKYHPSLEVQVAATDVVCNLVATFSPMRSELVPVGERAGSDSAGLLQILVDHAKSDNPELQLSSLWCLKNLANDCEKAQKVEMLERLDLGWLLNLIKGEQEVRVGEDRANRTGIDHGGGVSVGGLRTPNALGEQVNLLNPQGMDVDEDEVEDADDADLDDPMEEEDEGQFDHDLDLDDESDEEDDDGDHSRRNERTNNEDGEVLYDAASSTYYQSSQVRSTLPTTIPAFDFGQYLYSIRHMEQDPAFNARRNEAENQVHALDIIRNMINGEDALFMLDQITARLGGSIVPVYDLLVTKLSPLRSHSFDEARHSSSTNTTTQQPREVYNPTSLIHATIQLIAHLSNPSPAQRLSVLSHPNLLSALLPHFSHPDARIRTSAVWVINSLTWTEDENDKEGCRYRVRRLRDLGVEDIVRGMASDTNKDVQERVKTALRQVAKAGV